MEIISIILFDLVGFILRVTRWTTTAIRKFLSSFYQNNTLQRDGLYNVLEALKKLEDVFYHSLVYSLCVAILRFGIRNRL